MKKDFYRTIKAPHLTEKVTNLMNASNQYAFKVDVNKVRVLKVKGKSKRSRFRVKERPNWKKAYVSLAEGQTIDVGIE